ncbi:YceD family protein [Alkalibacterium sp. f15]|uniref:YceD family protein n=1 Tax=Alkalibacterium sp. f15 TaxID=3414029 RepID=UPI003BF85A88
MKIKWALNELKKYQDSSLAVNGSVDLEKSLKKRDDEIIATSPVSLKGSLSVEEKSVYYVDLMVSVRITIPSSRSLEPVDVSMEFPFSEIYLAPDSPVSLKQFSEEQLAERLSADILDLSKPIEDAILTNKPSQVFTDEELETDDLPSGKDWIVLPEDQHKDHINSSNDEGDPRFAVLKDLFKEDNE